MLHRFSLKPSKNTLVITFLVVLSAVARIIPSPRTIDDAYITFRYAQNIISGMGFVYNPGEHVLGTTTPVYALLMAGFGVVFGNSPDAFPWFALGLNTLADCLTCIILFRIGIRLKAPLAGFATALMWTIAPYSVTFAIGGMETSLFVFLLVAITLCYLEDRFRLGAFFAALAILTRPDAALFLLPVFIERLRTVFSGTKVRIGWIEILLFLIPTLSWVVFSSIYFGSPLPNSIAAKNLAYRLPPYSGFIRLLQHYATPFLEENTFGVPAIAVGLILYPFLFLVGAIRALRINQRVWPFILYPWLYFIAFAISNVLIFRWYLTPPLPIYYLGIFLGASELLGLITTKLIMLIRISSRLVLSGSAFLQIVILLLIPFTFLARGWVTFPDHGPTQPAPEMAWIKLELLYRKAADMLLPRLNPGDTIATGDVGVVGYYSSARILDLVGLNSPESLNYYPLDAQNYVINYAIPKDLIMESKPEFIVMLEVYGRESILKDNAFKQTYELVKNYSTDIYGSNGLLVFQRRTTSTQ